jgi:hypothetical protein
LGNPQFTIFGLLKKSLRQRLIGYEQEISGQQLACVKLKSTLHSVS